MKHKYYRIKEYLDGREAIQYLAYLTGVELGRSEFLSFIGEELFPYLQFIDIPEYGFLNEVAGELCGVNGSLRAVGLQKICSRLSPLFESDLGDSLELPRRGDCYFPDVLELEGKITYQEGKELVTDSCVWNVNGYELLRADGLFFKTKDIELLADRMNAENAGELRRDEEVVALKAEVEKLRAALSGGGGINRRKEETLYRIIIGMARGGYGYDFYAERNSATNRILKDINERREEISIEALRIHLNAAREYLPRKPEKT
ncbi:hypothetical protein [Paenalcaligenes suwonensis]|uniref:hypothetical protein n=1 Tax=Paenalcaligenes suwonensis TaxID=1202713 RepID=UPI001408BAFF|nr:hypothetical protein [Paenalcaligenes suwonensis]NHC62653.1 hypothetical protein [Paenalcaligenes suwonensis]